jgi:CBS domain-containing protein
VSIEPSTTLQETLEVLAHHNVLSVPVWNPISKTYEGIVSMYEIMSYLAWASWDGEHAELLSPNNFSQLTKAKALLETPAADLLGSSGVEENDKRKGLWVIDGDAGIKQMWELLSKGVYRLIVSIKGAPIIVSQSDFAKFIQENKEKFGSVKETIDQVKLGSQKVFTVHELDNSLYAFRQLRLKEVQGFAVVDENENLIGNFSSSDLRGLKKDNLDLLGLSVGEFLRQRSPNKKIRSPITVKSTDTLSTLLDIFVTTGVHRVFVVDPHFPKVKDPKAVITLSDIILYYFTVNLAVWYPSSTTSGPEDRVR